MIVYFILFGLFSLPGLSLGDLVFRCPSCTADDNLLCLNVPQECPEVVREPGCGCCPVCARLEGEPCGVYTPRCSIGLKCTPDMDAEFPLQQLIQGSGRCSQKIEQDDTKVLDHQVIYEVHGTENPPTKRPLLDTRFWHEMARKHHQNNINNRMRGNSQEDRVQRGPQSVCQEELDRALEEISRMTSEDNRGPLENLYGLKFPNCNREGLYNLKQCNMSTHGQRGECWCVNPFTGVQIPESPKVRGDPNCNQFQEGFMVISASDY
ncbi:insulin-like growth factor-binding protein 2-B [Nothobranchius furzeri]|uniref:Insulin-like growth factor-binding protein 2-B n=1 Tax=Nothobranchius furzeri TaxID=105023 RepID=A0A8C6VVY8_NOTFU|nr:insulin-like growth factor-binding protein 2-B [Nothobranchius furzeri]KAF7216240.1 insulin-like growth factor-binding protein 2-B [Nothobranchius furzeri]